MFAAEDLTDDGFLGGRLRILQPRIGYRAALDPVFLAAACPVQPGERVLELGCGAGVASLCLGWRVPGLVLTGVERQAGYADLARRNAARNGQALTVLEGDLADPPSELRSLSFDHVIANPPYLLPGSGTAARDPGRDAALREATPLAVWIDAGLRRLVAGGRLTLIQTVARLPDVLAALAGRAGDIAVLPLAPRAGHPANRVLLTARKGTRGAFALLAPAILHDSPVLPDHRETHSALARAVLRDGAGIGFATGGLRGLAGEALTFRQYFSCHTSFTRLA